MMGTLLQTVPCIFLFVLFFASPPLPSAVATPIGVPNLHKCELATDTSVVGAVEHLVLNCCLPIPTQPIRKFSFSKYKSERHVRQAAHTVSADYIAKYNKAYALMKALPDEDPRSFHTQANIHCAFCNFAYKQKGNSSVPLQVHFSWLFLTWHRWYLYFHERILQSLLGDPTFALVFWNWDDQKTGGNMMPAMFLQNNTAIYDANRNQAHLPPAIAALLATSTSNVTSVIINENLNAMYQGIVTADTAELFMGGKYVTGTDDANSTVLDAPLGGSIENGVHNAIHFWTGDPLLPLFQDMGTFSTAARDPIFFTHHSNVDRLWDVWRYKLPGGPREDHMDPDFLDARFVFYDENGFLVKVNVKDSLDNDKLGIAYPDVATDQLWITYTPNATTNSSAVPAAVALGVPFVGPYPENGTMSLGSRFAAIIAKPVSKSTTKSEILVIQGVQLIRDSFTSIRAFVNLPQADNTTSADGAEFLGDFNVVAAIGKHRHLTTNVQFEIGSNLRRIGIDNQTEVVITLVKTMGTSTVTFQGMRIRYA